MPATEVPVNYSLPAGQTLTFTGTSGLHVRQAVADVPVTLHIDGQLQVTAQPDPYGAVSYYAVSVENWHVATPGTVEVGPTGVIKVTGGSGITSPDGVVTLINHGLIDVTSTGAASGMSAGYLSSAINTGDIEVRASSESVAVKLSSSNSFDNSGTIHISQTTSVYGHNLTGVSLSPQYFHDTITFNNSGSIVADHVSDGKSIGAIFNGEIFNNSGLIQGDVALVSNSFPVTAINTGRLIGDIDFTGSFHNFTNSGLVKGAIAFGQNNDTYAGTGGTLTGVLHGGDGQDFIVGGAGAETLDGDAGNDTVEGGGGADVLDGGDGVDTLSFTHAASGVTVDFGSGRLPGGGTFTKFENLLGSTYGDSLTGAAGLGALSGAEGADTIDGRSGGQTINGGDGDDLVLAGSGARIDGGAGADTITLGANDTVVVGLHQSSPDHPDVLQNWTTGDHLTFGSNALAGDFISGSAGDYAGALAFAKAATGGGEANFVLVTVGSDLVVFADSANDNGDPDDAVVLKGINVATFDTSGIVAGAASPAPPSSVAPPLWPSPPTQALPGAHGVASGNMDAAHLADLLPATLTQASATDLAAAGALGLGFHVTGTNLTYSNNQLIGGSATHFTFDDVPSGSSLLHLDVDLPGKSVASFEQWLATDATQTAFNFIFSGNDCISGGTSADLIHGYGGNDLLYGAGGADTILGGDGNDLIYAETPSGPAATASGPTVLRGEAGNDFIVGGVGSDEVNGNLGNDTVDGGSGGVDTLYGGQGNDLVRLLVGGGNANGNIGNDSVIGSAGSDTIWGGQGNDLVWGGAGDDWLSGDRGDDTITGGAGADTFHSFAGGGVDRILDFNQAEGDHVQLDPGTHYSVFQIGGDVVVDMGAGSQVIIAGVRLDQLTNGWISA